jgi:hypothetical protein
MLAYAEILSKNTLDKRANFVAHCATKGKVRIPFAE